MMTFRHKLVSEALTEEKRWTSGWAEADQSESIRILKSNIASSVRGMRFIMKDRASLYMYIDATLQPTRYVEGNLFRRSE